MSYQLVIILISTLILIALSWRSLQHPNYHGFYRFFAWELIIIQITINLTIWFKNPFSWHQLISWFLLCLSFLVAYQGYFLLKRLGGERIKQSNNPNYAFENTGNLVTQGIYVYIRHPMYCSLLLLGWGAFFKSPSWGGIMVSTLTSVCLYATARFEEKENLRTFGVEYSEYMKHTKMFIPYLF